MKLVIPKQHGAWAMLIIPFLLSVILGKPTMYHIPLFLAWFFIYLATYPFLMYINKNGKKSIYMLQLYILLLRSYLG